MNKFLSNLKLGKKMLFGFGVSVFFLIVVIFTGITNLSRVNNEVNIITDELFPKTEISNDLIEIINENSIIIRNILLTDDIKTKEVFYAKFNKNKELATEKINLLKKKIKDEKGIQLLRKIKEIRENEFLPKYLKIIGLDKNNDKKGAIELLNLEFNEITERMINSISELIKYQTELVYKEGNNVQKTYDNLKLILIGVGLVSLIFVISFGFLVTRNIIEPVQKVKDRMSQLETKCLTNLENGLLL
ncbi:MAG: MCP four helix bundle domain-containing protein, partial [Ignavibacterium sp.]|nr:MCP four helix bundle domain-containing protein [Ignavibacterium sp.]